MIGYKSQSVLPPFLGKIYKLTYSYWAVIFKVLLKQSSILRIFFPVACILQEYLEGCCTCIFLFLVSGLNFKSTGKMHWNGKF